MGRRRRTGNGRVARSELTVAALLALTLAAAGCGPVPGGSTATPDEPAALPDDAVVARLGCTTLTAGDVRRWQRIVAAADAVAGSFGGGASVAPDFAAARADLLDRLVLRREAERNGLQVEDGEVQLALELLAVESGRPVDRVLAAARDRGLTEAEYRERVAADLLRFKVLSATMIAEGWPSHEDVVAECRRRHGEAGCSAEQASLVRDDLRQALTTQWLTIRGADWLAERRAAVEALVIEDGPEGCVERPAEAPADEPRNDGASAPDVPPPGTAPAMDGPDGDGGPAPGGP